MKRIVSFFHRFSVRVTIALIVSMFFVAALSNFFIYRYALDFQFKDLQEKLRIIAQTATLAIDVEKLQQVPLTRAGMSTPQYYAVAETLKEIKRANERIRYIYTMAKTSEPGVLQFIVDPNLLTKEEYKKSLTAFPGDRYDATHFPEMLKGFEQSMADAKLCTDVWGVTLSGYAPIRDKEGKVVAILGVDMMADQVYQMQRRVHERGLFVLLLGIIFSVTLGIVVSRRVIEPIRQLADATRFIAKGDLDYQVEVKGSDEIAALAGSFNSMVRNLSQSREKLHNYFYRVMQSLVRLLEAKDAYTKGHSERVSDYAGRIAESMGFDSEKVERIKEISHLHDIGKLVIHENVLNKKGPLTDQEWKMIKEHPALGEEVLKGAVFEDEMLAMVRSHHERYDGSGYPDKLKGNEINIFAQIISVADAFDAMTSSRAYRTALTREKALAEIKANSGLQFNAKVVEAALAVL
jgi:HD-GYP domain-containing protein (c-di-GMP phosphodiesterase class II)